MNEDNNRTSSYMLHEFKNIQIYTPKSQLILKGNRLNIIIDALTIRVGGITNQGKAS